MKLNQRLKATERIITTDQLTPQFERLAIEIINERNELTTDHTVVETPVPLNPIIPVSTPAT